MGGLLLEIMNNIINPKVTGKMCWKKVNKKSGLYRQHN